MMASELNLNHTTVHQVLTQELAVRKLCAKMVSKNLTIEQKENQKEVCFHLLEWIQSDRNFFKKVITGDESWIFEYDPEKKTKSGMAHICLTTSEKSENERVKNQIHAHLPF